MPGGADVPMHGKLVVTPSPVDTVLVNGVELTESSSLRALRAGLTFYGLTTSGSKTKCFARLLNHQKHWGGPCYGPAFSYLFRAKKRTHYFTIFSISMPRPPPRVALKPASNLASS